MTRKVRLSAEIASRIRKSHPLLKRKIRAAIDRILVEPSAGKLLKDELEGLRSFRLGKIRIVYRETEEFLEVVTVGPRATVYEESKRLLRRADRDHD